MSAFLERGAANAIDNKSIRIFVQNAFFEIKCETDFSIFSAIIGYRRVKSFIRSIRP